MNINVEGFKNDYRQWMGRYVFSFNDFMDEITIDLYQSSYGYFVAEPNRLVRHPNNSTVIDYISEPEDTAEQAITSALNAIKQDLHQYYPNQIPKNVFVNRELANLAYDLKTIKPVENKEDWELEKLRYKLKDGCYLEFQLEQNGTYTHWHDDSLFCGITLFNLMYETFCRNGREFDTYGVNLFTVSELEPLKEKIINRKNELARISSLSEFGDIVNFQYWSWIAEQTTWMDFRDAVVELLTAVESLIKQGQEQQKAVFILGV